MNRRGFCKSLAMVPVAAIAVSVGVPVAAHVVDLSNVKLQFPKLRSERWHGSLQQHVAQSRYGRILTYKVGDVILGHDCKLYRVTSVVHDEVTAELA